jgi:hypothetical protein
VGTTASEAEGSILVPLDFVETIKNTVGGIHFDIKVLPEWLGIILGVETPHDKGHGEGGTLHSFGYNGCS